VNPIDISKADIVDTTHVDEALASVRQNEANARKRATVLTWGKATLIGGLGVAAIIAAASLWFHPKEVIETTKVVETTPKVTEVVPHKDDPSRPIPKWPGEPPVKKPKVAEATPKLTPLPPPSPPPVKPPETHPWSELGDKHYEGALTDVINGHVCFDHRIDNCVFVALTDGHDHALLDSNGNTLENQTRDYEAMRKWIGYSVYSAAVTADPKHLYQFWVANNGIMTAFESGPKAPQT
jgi:hypothetical protein